MYYNTTSETGDELKESRKKSISQSDKVLDFFKTHKRATPSEVLVGCDSGMLLTSVRRCISDLTKDNYLEKTDEKKKGMYGKSEFIWQIHPLFNFVSNKPKIRPKRQSMISCIGYRGEN